MKKFVANIKKYQGYMLYSAKAKLKSEVAGSKLNWLWWILNPFLFMLVYTFVALIVFGKSEKYFPLFVFVGLNMWDFFSKTVTASVTAVKKNRSTIAKVYIPKYILVLTTMLVNGFKMCVAFSLVIIMIPIYRVPLTWHFLELIPCFIVLFFLTFGISCIVLDLGVFLPDLSNLITVGLRLLFYMTGIFFNVQKRVPEPYNLILLHGNPMSTIIQSARNCLLYEQAVYPISLMAWCLGSVLLCVIGVKMIVKHENTYVKIS